jgi:hypothetical protein
MLAVLLLTYCMSCAFDDTNSCDGMLTDHTLTYISVYLHNTADSNESE